MADLSSRRHWLTSAGALALAAALPGLAGCDRAPMGGPAFKAIDITGADYARDFALPDPDGRVRTMADFRGKVTVVFFGFTQCPDVCPSTLAELAEVKRSLGPAGADVQGVFVTIDPERDTPELLKAYVASFDPGFVAVRGDAQQTADTARAFKIFYRKVAGSTPETYTMDHTAGSYVFDRQGRVRLFTRYGTGPQALAHDLKLLLDGA